MKYRSRLSVTMLEDRANPSGMSDDPGYTPPSPYDPTLPPAQSSPPPPSTVPGPVGPYG